MRRLLVANRGEIALRAIAAARTIGLETVAVHSTADVASPHVDAADRAICIGPPPAARSYLDARALLHVAKATGCDGIYPGYGFLSERADFAAACEAAGLVFVGPSAEVIARMGDKAEAKATAARLGLPLVPGTAEATSDVRAAARAGAEIGFPLLIKARAGGGGRGMRVVHEPGQLSSLLEEAMREARAAFGDGAVYLERWLSGVRHIEVQVMGDHHGTVRHLGERDCSVQRRHQKLLEEGPALQLPDAVRGRMHEAAVSLAEGVGYVGAGTVEMVYEPATSAFYFIEMNTRIQVEHPVTEMLVGHDLVEAQLRIAMGEALPVQVPDVGPVGHAIEMRINAEDWQRGFIPCPGRVTTLRLPEGEGVRVDTFLRAGIDVVPFYDSLLAKLIVHGRDRTEALARARRALDGLVIDGVSTTRDLHRALLDDPTFIAGPVHTRWLEESFLSRL